MSLSLAEDIWPALFWQMHLVIFKMQADQTFKKLWIFIQTKKTHLFVVNVDIETISVYQVGFLLLTPVAGHVPEMNITMKMGRYEHTLLKVPADNVLKC